MRLTRSCKLGFAGGEDTLGGDPESREEIERSG
jgi:hypothetical protein